jgi:transposase InsO family protein
MPQTYLTDNHKSFTSAEYSDKLKEHQQVVKFAGVGAHHHNGVAERNIRTIVSIARTMMLHSAIHWPATGRRLYAMAYGCVTCCVSTQSFP